MDLEQALDRLAEADSYISSLRDQIKRERDSMRDRYEFEIARLRAENERLRTLLIKPMLLATFPPAVISLSEVQLPPGRPFANVVITSDSKATGAMELKKP